jgi:protease I
MNGSGSHSLAQKYMPVPSTLTTVGDSYPIPAFDTVDETVLAGKRVLVVSADGPELPEVDIPMEFLRARGAEVRLAGQTWIFNKEHRDPPGYIVIAQWLAHNVCVKADLPLGDVHVAIDEPGNLTPTKQYDAIFIPGGAWNPDMLRTDCDALRVVREARLHRVLIVTLCHGPQVLINAARSDPLGRVVFPRGTRITGVPSISVDLDNAGFIVVDHQPTVYDPTSHLLTARGPKDLGPLCLEMQRLLLKAGEDGMADGRSSTRSSR